MKSLRISLWSFFSFWRRSFISWDSSNITNNDLEKAYHQVKNELKNYSPDLLKKKELIVLNKIDLIDDELVEEIKDDFSKKINREILTLSTLEKNSVSKIKAKLISYVS